MAQASRHIQGKVMQREVAKQGISEVSGACQNSNT